MSHSDWYSYSNVGVAPDSGDDQWWASLIRLLREHDRTRVLAFVFEHNHYLCQEKRHLRPYSDLHFVEAHARVEGAGPVQMEV